MKKILLLTALPFQLAWASMSPIILTAAPVVGNMSYPAHKMFGFQVINPGQATVEAGVDITNPFVTGAFKGDHLLKPHVFNPSASQLVSFSPKRFVLAAHQSQSVRVFVGGHTVPMGDQAVGVYFKVIKTEGTRPSSPVVQKGKISMTTQVDVDQMSTLYIHHGKGKSEVKMTCQFERPKTHTAVVEFKNTSIWMLRPKFRVKYNGQISQHQLSVAPMMGMTAGTRQLDLPKNVKAPLTLVWTSPQGTSGSLTCGTATSAQ